MPDHDDRPNAIAPKNAVSATKPHHIGLSGSPTSRFLVYVLGTLIPGGPLETRIGVVQRARSRVCMDLRGKPQRIQSTCTVPPGYPIALAISHRQTRLEEAAATFGAFHQSS